MIRPSVLVGNSTEAAPLYVYDFDKHPPQDTDMLVTHSCELNYLWKPDLTGDPTLSKQM